MTLGRDWMGENPVGWIVTEKFDGCRAYWDGSNLWTRSGNIIEAPRWLTASLPTDIHLDGEMWAGRKRFNVASEAVRYGRFDSSVRFMVFDCPNVSGDWQSRIQFAPAANRVEFFTCENRKQLISNLLDVQASGGEGLMIRNPKATSYEIGRTRNLLKVKTPMDTDWAKLI